MKAGDSVRVKTGVIDPDLSIDIGAWQGRVHEVDAEGTAHIQWDSVTLRQMGMDLIIRCENENLDWRSMTLDRGEVESTRSRDSEQDVAAAVGEITREMLNDPRFDPDSEPPGVV